MKTIEITDPTAEVFAIATFKVESTAALMMHAFGPKTEQQMLHDHMGGVKPGRKPKDPEQLCLDAMHVIGPRPKTMRGLKSTRFGIPAASFKHGLVRMAKGIHKLTMTDARTALRVNADDERTNLVEIKCTRPTLDTRWARNSDGSPDIRCRPYFTKWSATVRVRFDISVISPQQIYALMIKAGEMNGVCELRPGGKTTSHDLGTWRVLKCSVQAPDDYEGGKAA